VFSTKEFQEWANSGKAVLFASVMTKIEGREHDDLLRTYGFRGFPSMAVLDADGTALVKGIARNLPAMAGTVEAAPEYVELSKQVEAGEEVDQARWFMTRLRIGQLSLPDALDGIERLDLSPEDRAYAEPVVLDMQLQTMKGDASKTEEAMAVVYKAHKAGKGLPPGAATQDFFDLMLAKAAVKNDDAKAFHSVYEQVKKSIAAEIDDLQKRVLTFRGYLDRFKDNEQMLERVEKSLANFQNTLEQREQDLEALREAAERLSK